jgi:uncharacterized protein YndB with AHSA1/START domain
VATNVKAMNCSPEDVFEVLSDGWLFPTWVVGASRMRDVDETWPREGAALQHSFGVWPLVIDDEAVVLEYDPPRLMRIQPKGWPVGEARVTIEVKPRGTGCVVRITEYAAAGPGRLVPKPIMDAVLRIRNHETLRRLAFISEGRHAGSEVAP